MSDRRARFLELQEKKKAAKALAGGGEQELRHIIQGQAPMESLTNSPEWEIFRQICQGWIDHLESKLGDVAPAFLNPETVTHEQMLELKFRSLILGSRVDTLREVIEMPKVIIEDGERARELLRNRHASEKDAANS